MGLFGRTYKSLLTEISDLKNRCDYKDQTIIDLREELEKIKNTKAIDISCEFDFAGKKAFSIERDKRTGNTIIGYIKKSIDGEYDDEWFFDTTDEIHLKLVSQFNDYIKHR